MSGGLGRSRSWSQVSEEETLALLSSIPKRSSWLVKWQKLSEFIRPHEPDWAAYSDPNKYRDPVYMEVHPFLAKHGGQIKMQEGLLKLGFVRCDRNKFQLDLREAQVQLEILRQEKRAKKGILGNSSRREKQHVTWQIPKEASSQPRDSPSSPGYAPPDTNEVASLLSVSASGEGASYCGTSTSGGDDTASDAAAVPDPQGSEYLREQVRELTRQVRMLRAASLASPTTKPVVPYIIHSNYSAPTTGHHPVRLQVNYLDPDLAPYRVAIQLKSLKGSGWYSPPCSVIDHQYVVFLAPPNPPGSYPVTLFGTTETGQLKKYCQSTWLEYKTVAVPADDDERSDSALNRSGSMTSPPSPRRGGSSRDLKKGKDKQERLSCIKGTRKTKPDRRNSIASGTSSAAPRSFVSNAQNGGSVPHTGRSRTGSPNGTSHPEVTLSVPQRREGLTHHQINEHNALNILPVCPVDPSEGPDTVDPTSDLKSHSEMKSEFTSDMAEEEAQDEEDYEVWNTRQFRALLPNQEPDTEHPPLTKEMLELLTLGHGWDKEEIMKSCTTRSVATLKTVNFMTSTKARSAGGSLRSTSPINPTVVTVDFASSASPSARSLQTQPLQQQSHIRTASCSETTSTSGKDVPLKHATSSADCGDASSIKYLSEQGSVVAGQESDGGAAVASGCSPPVSTPPSSSSPALPDSYHRRTRARHPSTSSDMYGNSRSQTPSHTLYSYHSPPSSARPPSGRTTRTAPPV